MSFTHGNTTIIFVSIICSRFARKPTDNTKLITLDASVPYNKYLKFYEHKETNRKISKLIYF